MSASTSEAQQKVDMNKIYQIESSGNPQAYNAKEDAIGLGQIRKVVRDEWNQYHPKEQYNRKQFFQEDINKKVSDWYMNERIPQMLKAYKIEDTIENRIIAYNAGIGILKNKKSIPQGTQKYIKKYKESK